MEKLAYWNEYKTKSENKNTVNEYNCVESNCVGANRLYVLVYSNQDVKMTMLKGLKLEDIIYQEAQPKIIMLSSMEKTFIPRNYSDIKRCEKY